MDEFYEPLPSNPHSGVVWKVLDLILEKPAYISSSITLALVLIVIATRLLSGQASEQINDNGDGPVRTVWMPSYWLPIVGHGFQL